MSIRDKIKNIALSYVGQREIPGNAGFTDEVFAAKMKEVGFQKGYAWCVFTAELIWKEAYAGYDAILKELDKLFSASATATYKNFDLDDTYTVSKEPVVGALAIWRYGNGWKGHAGVVVSLSSSSFQCVEGNTNSAGGREGIEVAKKNRQLFSPYTPNGLNLIGFVYPKNI